MADAVIEAREGVSLNKNTEEDEVVDMKAVLAEVKPTEEKEEAEEKKATKKPRAKKVVKEEAEVATETVETENKGE